MHSEEFQGMLIPINVWLSWVEHRDLTAPKLNEPYQEAAVLWCAKKKNLVCQRQSSKFLPLACAMSLRNKLQVIIVSGV